MDLHQKNKKSLHCCISHHELVALMFLIITIAWVFVVIKFKNIEKIQLFTEESVNLNDSWYYIDKNGISVPVHLPTSKEKRVPLESDGYSRIYCNIPNTGLNDFNLGFFTKHQLDIVTINDKILESNTGKNYPSWYSATGTFFHIVPVSFSSSSTEKLTLCIALKASSSSLDGIFSEVQYGSKITLVKHLLNKYCVKIIISSLLFILSFVILIISLVFKKYLSGDMTFMSLGFLTFLVSCWLLEESFVTQLLYSNPLIHYYFFYIFLITMPVCFLYFLENLSGNYKDKGITILIYTGIAVVFATLILPVLGKFKITHLLFLTHIFIFVVSIYTVYFFIRESRKSYSKIKEYFPAVVILLIGTCAEVIAYYFRDSYDSSFIIFLTFFIFFVLLGIDVYRSSSLKIQELSDAATYHKLAFIDFSTGVYNRTAYFTYVENFKGKKENFCLVLFDMNNLKKINDKYGHLFGDKVIKTFSDCAQKSFGSYGKVYRVGGDEFLTLIKNPIEENIAAACLKFEKYVAEQHEVDYKFTVSYGFTFFTAAKPDDFFEAQKIADSKMYEMKALTKRTES